MNSDQKNVVLFREWDDEVRERAHLMFHDLPTIIADSYAVSVIHNPNSKHLPVDEKNYWISLGQNLNEEIDNLFEERAESLPRHFDFDEVGTKAELVIQMYEGWRLDQPVSMTEIVALAAIMDDVLPHFGAPTIGDVAYILSTNRSDFIGTLQATHNAKGRVGSQVPKRGIITPGTDEQTELARMWWQCGVMEKVFAQIAAQRYTERLDGVPQNEYSSYDSILWTWLSLYPLAAAHYNLPYTTARQVIKSEKKELFSGLRHQEVSRSVEELVLPFRALGYDTVVPYLQAGVFDSRLIISAVEHRVDPEFVGAA